MSKVAVDSVLINSLFKCPLCYGLIRSPTVINECLHRFCKVCITNYFETNKEECPTCHVHIVNPLETLKSDLTFQRLLYKIFPSIFQRETICKPSLLSSSMSNESSRIYIDSTIDVYLEYWDISLDLFPNSNKESIVTLPSCYLECKANTPLALLEKFIRIKHSLSSELKVDLFYKTFLLDTNNEKLIDICYCFDRMNKHETLDIRFLISPYGYKTILSRIRQLKHRSPTPLPPKVEVTEPLPLEVEITEKETPTVVPSSPSNASSIDPKIKVKIRRSEASTNNWYIPQSEAHNEPVELPDLVNSCETTTNPIKRKGSPVLESSAKKNSGATSTFFSFGHTTQPKRTSPGKSVTKPRRRTRFIPTMVKAPPSIFDRLSMNRYDYSDQESDNSPLCSSNELLEQSVTTLRPSEMVIVNVEGNVNDPSEMKRTQKTVCKVPPYIPESASVVTVSPPEKSLPVVKPTPTYPTISPTRRALLPKKHPTIIPAIPNRIPSPDLNNVTPLDLSLK